MEASLNGEVEALQSLLEAVSHLKHYGVEDRDVIAAGVAARLRRKAIGLVHVTKGCTRTAACAF